MTLRKLAFLYAALLMLLLASVLISYRYFVSIPNMVATIDGFHQRELVTLNSALKKEISFLNTMNYDYAVWDESYQFVTDQSQAFIDENLLNDTFVSLKIDGIFYYDLDYKQIWGRGFDYLNRESIGFPELNLQQNPSLKSIFPTSPKAPNKKTITPLEKVPQNGGFILTKQGPVMFSATEVRHSDRSGDPVGVLVFVRKVRPGLIKSLQEISQLNLSSHMLNKRQKQLTIPKLDGKLYGETFTYKRQRIIENPSGEPVILLNIGHQHGAKPRLFDKTTLFTIALLALVPLSMLIFINRFIVSPVTQSAQFIRKMVNTKYFHHLTPSIKITEIKNLSDDFNQLINTVNEQRIALEELVLTDGLTHINNRRAFEQFIANSWLRMQRNHQPVALLMCDIDYFKPYNDNYGHQAGDNALKEVAKALSKRINRSSDMVARYGGEEFALVLADSSTQNCEFVIKIVLETVRALNISHQHSKVSNRLTISIGAALSSDFSVVPLSTNHEQFIKAADDALYLAKERGRNRAVKVNFIAPSNKSVFCQEMI
ncbi:MAG: diguanylate cyclase [Algicola sp.]|nr:diguanylate cyclase [Algicola sp.]